MSAEPAHAWDCPCCSAARTARALDAIAQILTRPKREDADGTHAND